MINLTHLKKLLFLMLFFLLIAPTKPLLAQNDDIVDGVEYWFAIPHCGRAQKEPVRWKPYAIQLWVTSKFDTKFSLESADGTSISKKNYRVAPLSPAIIKIADGLMHSEDDIEKVGLKGIHIISDDPISLSVFIGYKFSGEAFRIVPVEWLGTEYYTVNLYEDYVRMYNEGSNEYDELHPPQILVTATEDNTRLEYIPTAETPNVKAGASSVVNLNRGETFYIESKPSVPFVHRIESDLTGTHIIADKRVSVLSGHTKGCYPKISKTLCGGIKADFIRNMLVDMIWPVEQLGKEYVFAPIMYVGRDVYDIIDKDRGDMLRFVATQNNTVIRKKLANGTYLQVGLPLKAGEFCQIDVQEQAAFFQANKPVIVGQYGKCWMLTNPGAIVNPGDEGTSKKEQGNELQNPQRNGQGMLMLIPPIEKWCNYASFITAEGMNGFFTLTFRTKDKDSIKFDGTYISMKYGALIKPVAGSEYSYLSAKIASGDHYVDGLGGANFAGYSYGNWDADKDGFAYGYPIGVNYAVQCHDTIYEASTKKCGNFDIDIDAADLAIDTACAKLHSITFRTSKSFNYDFNVNGFKSGDIHADINLTVINPQDSAHAEILIMNRSGKKHTFVYNYYPEQITVDSTFVNFGILQLGDTVCKTITITNTGKSVVTIYGLFQKFNRTEYDVQKAKDTVSIAPGQFRTIRICGSPKFVSTVAVDDSLYAELSCYRVPIARLFMQTTDPNVIISDKDWGSHPVGTKTRGQITITNNSDAEAILEDVRWSNHVNFEIDLNTLELPLKLTKRGTDSAIHSFDVYFMPTDTLPPTYFDTAFFTGNTTKTKLYSAWSGSGTIAGTTITSYDWKKVRVIDPYTPPFYEGTVTIANTGNDRIYIDGMEIKNDPDGVFDFKNKAQIPASLEAHKDATISVIFKPKAEQEYISSISVNSRYNSATQVSTGSLAGIGAWPHLALKGIDFPDPLLKGDFVDTTTTITHLKRDVKFSWPLKAFHFEIIDDEKGCFTIDPDWLSNHQNVIVNIDTTFNIPVKFTAVNGAVGAVSATLLCYNDSPQSELDIDTVPLTGFVNTSGATASPHNYGTIFKYQKRSASVIVANLSTIPLTITKDITSSLTDDVNNVFKITSWSTKTLNNPAAPFDLQAGDTLTVNVDYVPEAALRSEANIVYENRNQYGQSFILVSNLQGNALEELTVASIPKGKYQADPGDKVTVEFFYNVNTAKGESKPLGNTNILKYKASLKFKPDSRGDINDIYPSVTGPQDIFLDGTMSESWTCESAQIENKNSLVVIMSQSDVTKPLSDKSTNLLFRFTMNTFLSDIELIPLECKFEIIDMNSTNPDNVPSKYVLIDTIGGDFRINRVCINPIRLVQVSKGQKFIQNIEPNPTDGIAKIKYTVPYNNAKTIVTVYNSFSELVATLYDAKETTGPREFVFDATQAGLASGVYFIRFETGGFVEMRTIVVAK